MRNSPAKTVNPSNKPTKNYPKKNSTNKKIYFFEALFRLFKSIFISQ